MNHLLYEYNKANPGAGVQMKKRTTGKDQFYFDTTVSISYTIPWHQKEMVRTAQEAGRLGKMRIAASLKGLKIEADHKVLAELGLAKTYRQDDSLAPIVRVAREKSSIKASQWFKHPSGEITAEIHIEGTAKQAQQLGKLLTGDRKASQVLIFDGRGWPHKIVKEKLEKDARASKNSVR